MAGAHVVVGSTSLGTLFGFAAASTLPGDFDYLTIQNPNPSPAAVTITYYTPNGAVFRSISVTPDSRHTVPLFTAAEGVGPGYAPLGIVVSSTQPILVEKPTYKLESRDLRGDQHARIRDWHVLGRDRWRNPVDGESPSPCYPDWAPPVS